ncbi:MAG: hypothetical protein M3Y82_03195, partial [Verrucomicrobiota bacterium]|nr:hypothetical protein [Verrucomicrobiota bacterium]
MNTKLSESSLLKTRHLNQKLDRHFLACSAFVGATVTLATQNANASIIYSGFQNISIPTTNGAGGIYIDLEIGGGGTGTFIPAGSGGGFGTATGWDINPYKTGGGRLRLYPQTTTTEVTNLANGDFIAPLTFGTPIDNTQLFSRTYGMVNTANTGPWVNTNAYMGIKFNTSTATGLFGWIRIDAGPTAGFPATIVDWAYE